MGLSVLLGSPTWRLVISPPFIGELESIASKTSLPFAVGDLAEPKTHTQFSVTASRGVEVGGELAGVVQGPFDAAAIVALKRKIGWSAHQFGRAARRNGQRLFVAQRKREHAEGADALGAVEPDLLAVNRNAGNDVIELRR